MPMTATGSVVETIDPSRRQTTIETGATHDRPTPMTNVSTRTATTARKRIGAASSRMRCTLIVSADWKSRSGRKM